MKPIKLRLSAFGPYAGEIQEIRFDQFEERGLFLITGDTGAGKTMIFDAICYALFGSASGRYRDTKNLRSEYAQPGCESFVEFHFSHQGRNYCVRRKPSYEREKLRGEGTVTENETAEFREEGKKPIEGIRQVNGAVQELLHIDEKQFKQIAMIAQGEFRDLLTAKTEQRTEILRTIFMTDSYKAIEMKLKDRMSASESERNRTEHSILQYFGEVTAAEGSPVQEELSDLQEKAADAKSVWNLEELLGIIDRVTDGDRELAKTLRVKVKAEEEALDGLKEQLITAERNNDILAQRDQLLEEKEALERQQPQIETLRQTLNKQKTATYHVAPAYRSWQAKEKEKADGQERIAREKERLAEAEIAAGNASEALAAAEGRREEANTLAREAETIAGQKKDYLRRDELRREISALERESGKLGVRQKEIEEKESRLEEQIAGYTEIIGSLENTPAELAETEALIDSLSALEEDLRIILEERYEDWTSRSTSLEGKTQQYQLTDAAYDEALASRRTGEKLLEQSRAGLLAAGLKEGEKCPVCGSAHHPEPAVLPADSISEDELEQLQRQEESAREAKDRAFRELTEEKAALEGLEHIIREGAGKAFRNELMPAQAAGDETGETIPGIIRALSGVRESLSRRIGETTGIRSRLEEDCRRFEDTKALLEQARGVKRNALLEEKETLLKQQQKNEVELAGRAASLQSIGDLKFPDWETAEKRQREAGQEAEGLLDAIKNAEKAKAAADSEVKGIDASIGTLQETLKRIAGDEEDQERAFRLKLQEHGFSDEGELLPFMVTEDAITASEEEIREYENRVERNRAKLTEKEKEAEGKHPIDIEALEETLRQQQTQVEGFRKEYSTIDGRIRSNTDKKNRMESQAQRLASQRKDALIYRRLYNLVRGNTGNGRITLEQYVQATGFDGIIRAANRRLMPMSDGQFELFRQEDNLGRRSNTFLDLEVLDNHTGHRRPVGDLSGGESFKASLSLALGLSDTVSSSAGGIQMDALFLDEGFGTLDRKSIESAMDVLLRLSEANKLVGIISHREELKENIPQQIRVTKTREGSFVTVDTGV